MFSPVALIITDRTENLCTAGPLYLVTKCLTKDILGTQTITSLDNDQPLNLILN